MPIKPSTKEYSGFPWPSRKGSVLVLALWALSLLAFFAVSMGFSARMRLLMMDRLRQRGQLRLAAEAGVARAKTQLIPPKKETDPDTLKDSWANDDNIFKKIKVGAATFDVQGSESFYGVVDEERKINVNTAPAVVLQRLFRMASGLSDSDAAACAAAVMDWREAGNAARTNGAKNAYYQSLPEPYECKNAPMDNMDELLLVRGVSAKIYTDICPYVTVAGSGCININTADSFVLQAAGLDKDLAEKILEYRRGEDGVLGTEDDRIFTSAGNVSGQMSAVMRLTDDEIKRFLDQLPRVNATIKATAFSVVSRGYYESKKGSFVIRAVFNRKPLENGEGFAVHCVSWRTQG
jgi:general secretion pathway protein K